MIVALDYASPSVYRSERDRALLGMAADAGRPVRLHGRVTRDVFLIRVALRALGEIIWSDDTWLSSGEILDPVITVHPDRVFFEAFSQDQSVYANVSLDRALLATEGEVATGTTNVDFTAWLWAALAEMRSSRATWLRIDPAGFEVTTTGSGGRFEAKVDVPDDWVRGFLEVQAAMAMPGPRLRVRPVELLSAIRFLRHTKARLSPRGLRWEMAPGEDARIVLEPWEHVVPLRGAAHIYTEPRVIRTWGRRRLRLLEPLLPFAESVEVHLRGRALPVFYVLHLGGVRVTVGLTGWSGRAWSGGPAFELLSGEADAAPPRLEETAARLATRFAASVDEIAADLGASPADAGRWLQRLCRLGRAFYEVEERRFRHRELFAEPVDEERFFPADRRLEQARELLSRGAVRVESCAPVETRKLRNLPTPEGRVLREIVYRDWQVSGSVGREPLVELVLNEREQILFGRCGCEFFQDNLLNLGPCEHLLALHAASAAGRRDLASSTAAPPGVERRPHAAPPARDEEGEEDEEA